MVKYTATYFIDQLQLRQHPEGGFYKELYRSDEKISKTALPIRYSGERNFYSSIYFLLKEENFSAFHKIDSDELWHFFAGECLEIIEIDEDGKLIKTLLGANLSSGEQFQ